MENSRLTKNEFIERLHIYMKFKHLNDSQLTVKAGLSAGLLGKAKSATMGMSSINVEKILRACPDLDARWLLTGEGQMITAPSTSINSLSVVGSSVDNGATIANEIRADYDSSSPDVPHLLERINYLERLLADKERIIALYERLSQQ